MPADKIDFLQRIQEFGALGYTWILFLSFWGGTVRYLTSLHGEKPTFLGWITETCVSGFVGIVAAMTCQYYQVDFLMTSAITGIAAHNGTRSLYVIGSIIKKNTQAFRAIPVDTEIESESCKITKLARRGK